MDLNKAPHDFRDHQAHMQWKVDRDAFKANVPLIPVDMSSGSRGANSTTTALQKAFSNPLVPLGMAVTTGCLIGMCVATLRRSSKDAQLFMRGRVVAQGLTVAALVGGALFFGIGAAGDVMKRETPPAHLANSSSPSASA